MQGTRLSIFSPYKQKKKLLWLLLAAVLLLTGSYRVVYPFYLHKKKSASPYFIKTIIQEPLFSKGREAILPTSFLAEVLQLSADQLVEIAAFDSKRGEAALLATHIIREVYIKKVAPHTLFIQYDLRVPFAYRGDYTNTAIDETGYLFPYSPFYLPSYLPIVRLGPTREENVWGDKIAPSSLLVLGTLYSLLGVEKIAAIDISQIEASSFGRREMVVTLRNGTILRLSPKNYQEQIQRYLVLEREYFSLEKPKVVDLRLPWVAYIEA